jgi:hypothetical protein
MKEVVMKPFVLKQHDKDFAKVRELRASELKIVSGGVKLKTTTVTPDTDGGDDGSDAS